MDVRKIEALRELGFSQAAIDELLALVAASEKDATAKGIRYKGADGLMKDRQQRIADGLAGALEQVDASVWRLYEAGQDRGALALAGALLTATKAALSPAPAVDPLAALLGADVPAGAPWEPYDFARALGGKKR